MAAGPGELPPRSTYWLTRFVFLRGLGLIYAVAFLVALRQAIPLIGAHGLLPARQYLDSVAQRVGSVGAAAWRVPTLFWAGCSDQSLQAVAGAGLMLSLVVLAGRANVPIMA